MNLKSLGRSILEGYSAVGRCQLGQYHVSDRPSTKTEMFVGRLLIWLSILGLAVTFLWSVGELHW